jgi:hypothetical protein
MASPRGAGPAPGTRRWLGWAAAAAAVVMVAFVAGRAGQDVELASPSASASPNAQVPIVFGTSRDPASGAIGGRASRFGPDDALAYSAVLGQAPGVDSMLLEVVRLEASGEVVVQAPSETAIDPESAVIGFTVRAGDLLALWGPGEYEIRMYIGPGIDAAAAGRFVLEEATAS